MTILQRREAGLRAAPLEWLGLVGGARQDVRQAGISPGLPGACQVAGLLYDRCPETGGTESGVLAAVHKVSGSMGITRLAVDTVYWKTCW